MDVLVAYASVNGSTKGIAAEIGERLRANGHHVEVRAVDDVDAVAPHDAVVVGSAIHNGRWLTPADAFLRRFATDLADRFMWCFSVCSVGETSSFFGPRATRAARKAHREPPVLTELTPRIGPRDHRFFAGAIEPGQWGFLGGLALRVAGGTYGDHRDWADIDAWADDIARQLQEAPRPTSA